MTNWPRLDIIEICHDAPLFVHFIHPLLFGYCPSFPLMEIEPKSLYPAVAFFMHPMVGGDARNFYAENEKIRQSAKENTVQRAICCGNVDVSCHTYRKSSRVPRDNTSFCFTCDFLIIIGRKERGEATKYAPATLTNNVIAEAEFNFLILELYFLKI